MHSDPGHCASGWSHCLRVQFHAWAYRVHATASAQSTPDTGTPGPHPGPPSATPHPESAHWHRTHSGCPASGSESDHLDSHFLEMAEWSSAISVVHRGSHFLDGGHSADMAPQTFLAGRE